MNELELFSNTILSLILVNLPWILARVIADYEGDVQVKEQKIEESDQFRPLR